MRGMRRAFLQDMVSLPDGAPPTAASRTVDLFIETENSYLFVRSYYFRDEAEEGLKLLQEMLAKQSIAKAKRAVASHIHAKGVQATQYDELPNYYRPPKRRKAYL